MIFEQKKIVFIALILAAVFWIYVVHVRQANQEKSRAAAELIMHARQKLNTNKFSEAGPLLKKAVEMAPEDPETWFALADYYETIALTDQALKAYETALDVDPDRNEIRNRLGNLYGKLGRADDALIQFEAVVENDPNDADARGNLGNLFLAQGNMEKAAENLERAVELDENDPVNQYRFGLLEYTRKNYAAAIAMLEKSLRHDPPPAEGSYYLSKCYEATGDYKKAYEAMEAHAGLLEDEELKTIIKLEIRRLQNLYIQHRKKPGSR